MKIPESWQVCETVFQAELSTHLDVESVTNSHNLATIEGCQDEKEPAKKS
jgi:hypothetical protein